MLASEPLIQSAWRVHLALLPFVVAGATWVIPPQAFALSSLAFSLSAWMALWALIQRGLPDHHPYEQFGLANTITSIRAAITVAIFAGISTTSTLPADSRALWVVVVAVVLALVLDGFDGHAARATGQQSAFGARFDMEVDAMLALVTVVLLWQLDKCGPWVLGLGVMRYLFLAAAYRFPQLAAPLFPSTRRKVICVIQVAGLCVMLAPVVQPPLSTMIGTVALALLIGSFLRDTLWLMKKAS